MLLEHEFTVPVSRDQAWDVLMDVERIAPCMPGATLDGFEGDHFLGRVKVKLGPITITYAGKARFIEQDKAAGRAVIDAAGKESRGTGTAHATVTTLLHDEGDSTRVAVTTELDITGKPAQFGRGVMVDVGAKIIGQFAGCLASQLSAPVAVPALAVVEPPADSAGDGSASAASSTDSAGVDSAATTQAGVLAAAPRLSVVPPQSHGSAEAIDLLDAAGAPLLKRVLPVVGGILGLLILLKVVRRRLR